MVQVQCQLCSQVKDDIDDFYWNKTRRQNRCKECQKKYVKAWNLGNKNRTNLARTDGKC